VALRDLLKRLFGSEDDPGSRQGVRRARLQPRAPDQPTVRVGAAAPGPPLGRALGAAGPPPTEVARPVLPPAAPLSPAQVAPPPAAAPYTPPPAPPPPAAPPPAAPAHDLGGATQYVSVLPTAAGELVGLLVGIDGPLKGEVYKLRDGENTLGREGCDVLLPSRRISRFHAKVHHEDGAFVIEANTKVMDRNPTVLNDQEIDAEGLSDGDVLRLGDCTFKFRTV
jgi:FHA domain